MDISQAKVKKNKNLSSKLEKKIIIILVSVIALSLLFFATARNLENKSSTANNKSENTEEEKLNENNSEMNKKDDTTRENGNKVDNRKILPRKFPSDFPIYPNSQITQESGNEVSTMREMVTEDELDKVSDYFNTNLPTQGWNITNSTAISNAVIYEVTKQDEAGAVIISRVKDETKILIDIGENPEDKL